MNRPIKFRGKRLDTGEFVYGDLIQSNGGASIFDGTHRIYVKPDSVAQLVGYDKDGNELYEGDTFVVPCGTEVAARLFDNITPNAKLKEAA